MWCSNVNVLCVVQILLFISRILARQSHWLCVVRLVDFVYLPLQGHLQVPCNLLSKPYLHNMAGFPFPSGGIQLGPTIPSSGLFDGGYPLVDPQYNAIVEPTNLRAFMQLLAADLIPPIQVKCSDNNETPL